MASILNSFIDSLIDTAAKDGALENLPGQGKPLDTSSDPYADMAKRMGAEAGYLHPLVELKHKIATAQAHLKTLEDPSERTAQMKVLADLQTQLAVEMETYRP